MSNDERNSRRALERENESNRNVARKAVEMMDPPRRFDLLREWFRGKNIEGIVWHHPDGRMVKIKKKDFGLGRRE